MTSKALVRFISHRCSTYSSNVTQQRMADAIGKSQNTVCYMLRFGAFLDFITTVIKPTLVLPKSLTERRFCAYWDSWSIPRACGRGFSSHAGGENGSQRIPIHPSTATDGFSAHARADIHCLPIPRSTYTPPP